MRYIKLMLLSLVSIPLLSRSRLAFAADILMMTMGGTKSHKIPFWELAKGLIPRGHNVTFLSGFPADFSIQGLEEITPVGLVNYISNYTNWDLVGARMRGDLPLSVWDVMRYGFESCEALLNDIEMKELLLRKFHLAILDGAFPECLVAIVYKYKIPFMYINTVGFYTGSMSMAGNPSMYSTTPAFYSSYTDNMNFVQRLGNTMLHLFANLVHLAMAAYLQPFLRSYFGDNIPHVYDLSRNVSFILQNGHATVSYPRALQPNVAEIACIHCKPAQPLPKNLEDFIRTETGFIYVSMGSSVKAVNMPEHLRRLMINTFAQLPYQVLWKWEGNMSDMHDLPMNVMLGQWLPQQDILGHRKLRAFVTHGGLLSMYESVYHGVPMVSMPVFCDHDANVAKAETDGYALKINLETITAEKLFKAILNIIHDPKFRKAARKRQHLLLDQKSSPLETAVYWTEYVIRHKGAHHLQTPSRNLSFIQYYLIDVATFVIATCALLIILIRRCTTNQEDNRTWMKDKIN